MNWKKWLLLIINILFTRYIIVFIRWGLPLENRTERGSREEKNRRNHLEDTWPCLHLAGSRNFFLLYYKCIHVYLRRISKLIMHVHLIHVIWSLGYNNRTKVSVILFPVIGIGNESKAIQLYYTVLYWLRIGLPQGTPEGIETIILSSSR